MDFEELAGKGLFFIAMLFAVVIIVSNIVGFFWLNSPAIILISLLVSFFLTKKLFKEKEIRLNKTICVLVLLLIIMLAYPVMLLTPFFPAGADAVSTTMLRVLNGSIPLDYGQYSSLNLSYQMGFSLVANSFSEILPVIPDYLWPWALGILAAVLQLFFVYLFSKEFFKSEKIATATAILFFGGKLAFENNYNGEFAWVLATAFMFMFLYLYLKKNRLRYLALPAVFATHPAIALNLLIFLAVHYAIYRPKLSYLIKTLASAVLVIPLILMSYTPILFNMIFNRSLMNEGSIGLVNSILIIPIWIGSAVTIAFGIIFLYLIIKRKPLIKDKQDLFVFSLFFVSVILSIIFSLTGSMLFGREIELVLIAVLLLSANMLGKIKIRKMQMFALAAAFLMVALFFFTTSSTLSHYREGSKCSLECREFSQAFYSFDSAQKRVLFLATESGKIAEYSNKIPYDVNAGQMILLREFSYYPGPALEQFKKNSKMWEEIFYAKKVGLIKDLNVDYIVVNRKEFEEPLQYEKIFEYKNFDVYEKNQP